jgi:NADH-quinone oxidoreductase subunit G
VMSDLRVLAALADGLGADLGVRTAAEARAELSEFGAWEGHRAMLAEPVEGWRGAAASTSSARGSGQLSPNEAVLATWRLQLDDARAIDGEPHLAATARKPLARLSARTAAAAGVDPWTGTSTTSGIGRIKISTDRGAVILDAVVEPDMIDSVVWLPARAPELAVGEHLAVTAGEIVRIEGAQ